MLPDNLEEKRLAEMALAILSLTDHDGGFVWKSLDFDLMNLLHEKGWISDPRTRNKSVFMTEEGQRKARLFRKRYLQRAKSQKRVATSRSQDHAVVADPEHVHIVCCTAKLLKELRISPVGSAPETVPKQNEWHANLLRFNRRKCVLFTHSQTLYSFLIIGVRRADFDNFADIFAANLAANLAAENIGHVGIERMTPAEVIVAKTNNRSVLGSMNDLAYQAEAAFEGRDIGSEWEVLELNRRLNQTPMGAIGYDQPVSAFERFLN